MSLLGIDLLRSERLAFMGTIHSLTDDEFENGRTLCSNWAPRDVLAHLIGTADARGYLRAGLRFNAANNQAVAQMRALTRDELTALGDRWAERPTWLHQVAARFYLGDVCTHHQDVLRGLGRSHDLPDFAAAAVFREGVLLSTGTNRNLLRYRVEPTTPGVRPLGRGQVVRGSAEALGLWLAGRKGIDKELHFNN